VATEKGGPSSHAAIIAASSGIPAVVGVGPEIWAIKDGDRLIVDGLDGAVIHQPTESELVFYRVRKTAYDREVSAAERTQRLLARTRGGTPVTLEANVANLSEVDTALAHGAQGIGVFRTEFLFMSRKEAPGEEEQFQTYRSAAVRSKNLPLTIRTFDIGGDKEVPYLGLSRESNPFLGVRAIRIGLMETDLLKAQFRAILRASAYGNVRVMFPFVSMVEEIEGAKALLDQCRTELSQAGHAFDKGMKIGIMVEIPSAAIMIEQFLPHVDFVSIGTNDLIQYTLAVDRLSERLSPMFSPFHPAVLALIEKDIRVARRWKKEVAVCGEMASDPPAVPLLIGMGLEQFSMVSSRIPQIKLLIRKLGKRECLNLLREAKRTSRHAEIRELSKRFIEKMS
jgi:phosphotransferase system enzyme I (PtsI)